MKHTIHIPYKRLRQLNHEAARLAVLEYLDTNGGNKADTARVFGITRPVVYDILAKHRQGCLKDKSKAPKKVHNKTSGAIEALIVEIKNKTNYGPERISDYAQDYHQLKIASGTIRHVLRRNKDKLKHRLKANRLRRGKREFIDWYSAKPFEIVQVDLKYIRDQKALTKKQLIHLDEYHIPNYQWSALDVNSRLKLTAYSREKSWTNGLCFFLWVTSWLRDNGVKAEIAYTVDNGEEFGGRSWIKIKELRQLLKGFGCRLIQNRKGHCEENAHVERSHRTDDDEFYCLRSEKINSEEDLCEEGFKFMYYYNNLRKHSSLGKKTPFQYLKMQLPEINDNIRLARPFMLDGVSVKIGPWSGYNVLAHYRVLYNTK